MGATAAAPGNSRRFRGPSPCKTGKKNRVHHAGCPSRARQGRGPPPAGPGGRWDGTGYQVSSIKMGCFCWLFAESKGSGRERRPPANGPPHNGWSSDRPLGFVGVWSGLARFSQEIDCRTEPFAGLGRITDTFTAPERRGQEDAGRVNRIDGDVARGCRVVGRVRGVRPLAPKTVGMDQPTGRL